jgi:hypothetical protein
MAIRKGEWKPQAGETLGNPHLETEAHAIVCNMAWIDGECPYDNIKGKFAADSFGKPTTKVLQRPLRGVREGLQIMLQKGVLRRSVEVGLILNDYSIVREGWGRE